MTQADPSNIPVDETALERSQEAIDEARDAARKADESPLVDIDPPEAPGVEASGELTDDK